MRLSTVSIDEFYASVIGNVKAIALKGIGLLVSSVGFWTQFRSVTIADASLLFKS